MKKDTEFNSAVDYVNYVIKKLKIKPLDIDSGYNIRVRVHNINTLYRLEKLIGKQVREANKEKNHYFIDFWYNYQKENSTLITFYTSNQ